MPVMKYISTLLVIILALAGSASAQINFTANDFAHVPLNNESFQYGANMGYYGPTWDDATLSDIAAGNPLKNVPGAGVKSLHLTLPESFLAAWSYDIRVDQFNHYASLGMKN